MLFPSRFYVTNIKTHSLHSVNTFLNIYKTIDKYIFIVYYFYMRYESITKTERNTAVINYQKENPDLSLKEIGEKFSITAQRVHQIIKRNNKKRKK